MWQIPNTLLSRSFHRKGDNGERMSWAAHGKREKGVNLLKNNQQERSGVGRLDTDLSRKIKCFQYVSVTLFQPEFVTFLCWCLKKVTQSTENKSVRYFFCISGADFSVTKSQESERVFWLSQREGSETVRKWRARCKDEILCAVRTKYFALGAWNVMRTVPTFRRTSKVSSDSTLSDKKRNSYAAAMMDSRLQAGTEGEGAPLMSWKSTIERHTLFLKEWKKESFLFYLIKQYIIIWFDLTDWKTKEWNAFSWQNPNKRVTNTHQERDKKQT